MSQVSRPINFWKLSAGTFWTHNRNDVHLTETKQKHLLDFNIATSIRDGLFDWFTVLLVQINVVTEPRLYPKWTSEQGAKSPGVCNMKTGITAAKKAINNLHDELGRTGFEQVYFTHCYGPTYFTTSCPQHGSWNCRLSVIFREIYHSCVFFHDIL